MSARQRVQGELTTTCVTLLERHQEWLQEHRDDPTIPTNLSGLLRQWLDEHIEQYEDKINGA